MKVILNVDIPNLGEEGDVLNVAPGYARNFLLPRGFVSMYNKTNLAVLEGKKKAIEKRRQEKKRDALSLKEKINASAVEFRMPAGDNGKLFGAVTAQMLVEALAEQGIIVERKKVEIPGHTLKALGNYKIHIRLYGDEDANLTVRVIKEEDGKSPSAPASPAPVQEKKPAAAEAPEAVAAAAPEADESEADESDSE